MPTCSVIGCGIRKTPNQPSLTIHRIPRNERKKKKWLEAIGMESINPNVKDIYICSLHFDDKCFNKTLNVTRLRDDAVPFKFIRQHASQHKTGILKENQLETIPVLAGPDTSTLVPPKVANTCTYTAPHAVAGASGIATFILPMTTTAACTDSFASVPGTSGVDNLPDQAQKIKKLEDKCDFLRKKVKILNEKVRRQKKKIAGFQNIIKDLQERNLVNNENSIVLEASAGPKTFLKRQISKSKGLPLEKQYSEETRKFALTLHFFSPKAYNFVRRTYNTCLPHPRTLTRWYQKINKPTASEPVSLAPLSEVPPIDSIPLMSR